jgi:hypothetical protein
MDTLIDVPTSVVWGDKRNGLATVLTPDIHESRPA